MTEFINNPYLLLFAFVLLIQLVFIWILFGRLAFRRKDDNLPADYELRPVSVIIVAKNEAENLYNNLPKILSQSYPDFEVIVVDDQSKDESTDVLKALKKHYHQLEIVYIGHDVNERQGKKLALSLGIKKAKNELLLFTDADCSPVSDNWIKLMVRGLKGDKEIVTGFSPYSKQKGLLNLIVQYDTYNTALQYLSFSLAGMPYMGVGRNLLYTKSLFFKHAFNGHLHLPYGDDDLFVNKNASSRNTSIEIHKDSFMMSAPPQTFKRWVRQKRRHLKAGKEYKKSHKWWLGGIWFSYFIFMALFALNVVISPLSLYVWGIFALRFVSSTIVSGLSLRKFGMIRLIWFMPVLELIYNVLYVPLMSLNAKFSKIISW